MYKTQSCDETLLTMVSDEHYDATMIFLLLQIALTTIRKERQAYMKPKAVKEISLSMKNCLKRTF